MDGRLFFETFKNMFGNWPARTFVQDSLKTSKEMLMKDSRNFKTIKEGDEAAHLGSAAADAQIYFDGIRKDGHVYAQLYGLPINGISEYFRKLQLLLDANNQNTELTQFNRSLAVHEVDRPSWLFGSQTEF